MRYDSSGAMDNTDVGEIERLQIMHMIRKGQFNIAGCDGSSFADQFYALAGQVRPK